MANEADEAIHEYIRLIAVEEATDLGGAETPKSSDLVLQVVGWACGLQPTLQKFYRQETKMDSEGLLYWIIDPSKGIGGSW